ncbi:hypothetical protein [Parafrankia sp. CH37]|uniref:hypothetical protein n=1 Tax=Parafrankia sp. CH37 TaxID=683308 RepID=UPI001D0189E5|nr:hypothetical protein [Parafrankia sp. CH37]
MLAVLVLAGAAAVTGWRPSIPNPFAERTIDRSSPAVLRSLEDLSEYHAGSAHLEVVVDLEDDSRWIRRRCAVNAPCSSESAVSTPSSTSARSVRTPSSSPRTGGP